MKIAISCLESTIKSKVSGNFGRAPFFAIFNEGDESLEFFDNNESDSLSHGAGLQTVKNLSDRGVNMALTGQVGPKASQGLEKAGIKVITGISGLLEDVLSQIKNKELPQ